MWQMRNGEAQWVQSKHIYVGETRIGTKYNSEGNENTGAEKERVYYYHSDHLGSAQVVTNHAGQLYERLEYTPYGETWIEWRNAGVQQGETMPYRFTGKERDEETGLYYYGARYLDPKTSRWLSADPAMGEYIPGAPISDEARRNNQNLPGMGGVFNLVNLHVYHYAGNNPVKYIDPDGRLTYENTGTEGSSNWQWTIESGDTITKIAKETGFTNDEILAANPQIEDADKIYAGDSINIPQTERIKAFQWATQQVGSGDYAMSKRNGNYWKNTWKCTAFIGDAYSKGAGINDYPGKKIWFGLGPFRYATTSGFLISGDVSPFSIAENAMIGDLAIFPPPDGYQLGHATIRGLGDTFIGAAEFTVVIRNSGYMKSSGYGDAVFWRYK
jgi:RHS repeat-associated protein